MSDYGAKHEIKMEVPILYDMGDRGDEFKMSTMPAQKPGRSRQDYCTPKDFFYALECKLNIEEFAIDLAASDDNALCDLYYTEKDDALVQSWAQNERWGYCNPPFAHLEPWVAKGWIESKHGASTAMLLPASPGSNWWGAFVHDKAYVLFVSPRLTFEGAEDPYPKDLAVVLYTPTGFKGYDTWRYK